MSNRVPPPTVPDHRGFMNIPLSAQALFFHLWVRSVERNGRVFVDCVTAKMVRVEIGATDSDVKALVKNGFVHSEDGRIYLADRVEWMPGPIEEIDGVDTVRCIFPGSRMEYMRRSMESYQRELREWSEQHAGRV